MNWTDVPTASVTQEWARAIEATRFAWSAAYAERAERNLRVEGLFSPHLGFEALGVRLPKQALGTTCFTQIASYMAFVSTPKPPERNAEDPFAMAMPQIADPWLREADWSGFLDLRNKWGRNEYAKTFRIAVDVGDEDPRVVGRQVRDELPAWWRRVAEWFELLGDGAVGPVDNFHWSDGSTALYARDDQGMHHVDGETRIWRSSRPASRWKVFNGWPEAAHLAGLGFTPPLPCSLTADAIRAHRDGRFRTCVIEAGTACEIALREALLRARVPHRDKDTLGPLAELVRGHIQGLVPDGFYPNLVRIRNEVVHHGRTVNDDTAAIALDFAQAVVRRVYPLTEARDAGLVLPA